MRLGHTGGRGKWWEVAGWLFLGVVIVFGSRDLNPSATWGVFNPVISLAFGVVEEAVPGLSDYPIQIPIRIANAAVNNVVNLSRRVRLVYSFVPASLFSQILKWRS